MSKLRFTLTIAILLTSPILSKIQTPKQSLSTGISVVSDLSISSFHYQLNYGVTKHINLGVTYGGIDTLTNNIPKGADGSYSCYSISWTRQFTNNLVTRLGYNYTPSYFNLSTNLPLPAGSTLKTKADSIEHSLSLTLFDASRDRVSPFAGLSVSRSKTRTKTTTNLPNPFPSSTTSETTTDSYTNYFFGVNVDINASVDSTLSLTLNNSRQPMYTVGFNYYFNVPKSSQSNTEPKRISSIEQSFNETDVTLEPTSYSLPTSVSMISESNESTATRLTPSINIQTSYINDSIEDSMIDTSLSEDTTPLVEINTDIQNHWVLGTVTALQNNDLLEKTDLFNPNQAVDRDLFSELAVQILDIDYDLDSDTPNSYAFLIKKNILEPFKERKAMTRSEAASAIHRLINPSDKSSKNHNFIDLKSDHWCYLAVSYLTDQSIITKSSRFYPNRLVTKAELISMLSRSRKLVTINS